MGYTMKTPKELVIKNKIYLGNAAVIYADVAEQLIEEYAQEKAREMVLEYARWYESNSVAEENQNEDWMIEQNVKSFYDVRL